MKTVDEISGGHLGKKLRVESADGAMIEGTLHSVAHVTTAPWGQSKQTILTFEELLNHPKGKDAEYIVVDTYGNRYATVMPDE